jgi:hypothetical protein
MLVRGDERRVDSVQLDQTIAKALLAPIWPNETQIDHTIGRPQTVRQPPHGGRRQLRNSVAGRRTQDNTANSPQATPDDVPPRPAASNVKIAFCDTEPFGELQYGLAPKQVAWQHRLRWRCRTPSAVLRKLALAVHPASCIRHGQVRVGRGRFGPRSRLPWG